MTLQGWKRLNIIMIIVFLLGIATVAATFMFATPGAFAAAVIINGITLTIVGFVGFFWSSWKWSAAEAANDRCRELFRVK